jgi:hypothetical protein
MQQCMCLAPCPHSQRVPTSGHQRHSPAAAHPPRPSRHSLSHTPSSSSPPPAHCSLQRHCITRHGGMAQSHPLQSHSHHPRHRVEQASAIQTTAHHSQCHHHVPCMQHNSYQPISHMDLRFPLILAHRPPQHGCQASHSCLPHQESQAQIRAHHLLLPPPYHPPVPSPHTSQDC